MHILLIHQAFAALGEPGGTRHHELARLLTAGGHRVTVIASPVSYLTGAASASLPQNADGVTILRAFTYQALHKSFFHRLLAFFSFMASSFWVGLTVRQVDLVWGTSPPIFQGFTAWALARLKGAKFLFEVRDLWPSFAIAVGVLKNPLLIKMSLWLEAFLYSHADQVMVNSPGYLEHVRRRGAKQVELIPNGADPSMFHPQAKGEAWRKAQGLEDKFIALYAGAHGMSNDLDVALDAAALLADSPQIEIILLGDGKEKPRLQARAAQMGLTNLRFLPPVSKEEIPLALAGADACFALLKPLEEYKSTYPNKIFDYMAAGRPIALGIDGVIREVVEGAGCGIFCPPGNAPALAAALRRLQADPLLSQAMGAAGRAALEKNFSREAIAQKLENVLQKIDKNE